KHFHLGMEWVGSTDDRWQCVKYNGRDSKLLRTQRKSTWTVKTVRTTTTKSRRSLAPQIDLERR
ncbi:hypothetical protein ACFLV6_02345, partial [Chloroflexota bacterium]